MATRNLLLRLSAGGFCRPGLINRTRRGTTAVEMALIAPVFFLMMIGVVEVSMMMLTEHLMENAAYNATRLASTGYTSSGQTQQQTVTTALMSELGSLGALIDTSKVIMQSTAYNTFNAIGANGQGTPGMGTTSQIVVYTITYPWQLFTPMLGTIIGTNGKVNLTSQIVVRNEPY